MISGCFLFGETELLQLLCKGRGVCGFILLAYTGWAYIILSEDRQ
jgi:hypothetical protein